MEETSEVNKSIAGKVLDWTKVVLAVLPLLTGIAGGAVAYYVTTGENTVLKNENARLRQDLDDQRKALQVERDEAGRLRAARDTAEKELSATRGELAKGVDQQSVLSTQGQQLSQCLAQIEIFQANRDDIAYIANLDKELDRLDSNISFKVGALGGSNESSPEVKELRVRRDALQSRLMDAQARLRYVGPAKSAVVF
jgi:chromosome segregation ATPase